MAPNWGLADRQDSINYIYWRGVAKLPHLYFGSINAQGADIMINYQLDALDAQLGTPD